MPEIQYQSLPQYLKETGNASFAPIYLIYGEDFLYEQAVNQIVNVIIPDHSKQRHGYEIIRQQESSQIIDVTEKINTYAFFNHKKIIELRDSNIFVGAKNQGKLIGKIKKAYDNSDIIRATRYYLELLERLKVDIDDICDENILNLLGIESNEFPDIKWLLTVNEETKQNTLTRTNSADDIGLLEQALVNGFPKNNHLIISTDTIDKRSSLFQAIKKYGVIIDCSVSRGSRKADKDIQRQTLANYMNRELKKYHKQIDPEAFDIFYERIGFDIRNFAGCLEKTIQYVGDRTIIDKEDVEAVLHRGRLDPIYEITGAIMEKNLGKSINFLSSLLDSGYHPLQILTAITNQVRRVLLIKEFMASPYGNLWRKGIRFDQFQNEVTPAIRRFDDALLNHLDEQKHAFWEKAEIQNQTSKKNVSSDLFLLKKDQHPYAVYVLFLKADLFDHTELLSDLMNLSQADAAMKTSGQRPKSILEELIISICRPKCL
jgi:DNA polymerase III subunit delta